ncbi:MAG: phage holin family protein [Rhodoferax sp.]
MNDTRTPGSSWDLLKSRAVTLLGIGQTRLELLGNELEVGRVTAMRQLMLALALLFCLGLGLVLAVVALTLLFWEQRLVVVSLAAALVWGLAVYFYLAMGRLARKTEPLFAASLAELQEDLRQLREASGRGRSPD